MVESLSSLGTKQGHILSEDSLLVCRDEWKPQDIHFLHGTCLKVTMLHLYREDEDLSFTVVVENGIIEDGEFRHQDGSEYLSLSEIEAGIENGTLSIVELP